MEHKSGDCLIEGTITPVESGGGGLCGGTITYTWDYTDTCGNNINYIQNVTINPPAVPAFINPPADLTVDCDNIPTSGPDLDYTNGGAGSCLFEGTITPVESGIVQISVAARLLIPGNTRIPVETIFHIVRM